MLAEDHSPIPGFWGLVPTRARCSIVLYAGGLATALVFGLQAAATATAQPAAVA